jgi:hypothetical protein
MVVPETADRRVPGWLTFSTTHRGELKLGGTLRPDRPHTIAERIYPVSNGAVVAWSIISLTVSSRRVALTRLMTSFEPRAST